MCRIYTFVYVLKNRPGLVVTLVTYESYMSKSTIPQMFLFIYLFIFGVAVVWYGKHQFTVLNYNNCLKH